MKKKKLKKMLSMQEANTARLEERLAVLEERLAEMEKCPQAPEKRPVDSSKGSPAEEEQPAEKDLQITGPAADRAQIENLMARHQHYLTGNRGADVLRDLWACADDISFETGASGVYIGSENVRKYYEKDARPGRLIVQTLNTPDIVISEDGLTAQGLWFLIGAESDAGDLGPCPPQTQEQRELLSSTAPDGAQYLAEWVWGKLKVSFRKESGGWRIYHYHFYELFRCPYQTDWVRFSEERQDTDGLRLEAMFLSNLAVTPEEKRENHASRETTYHRQYRTDAAAEYVPVPPSDEK